MKNPVLMSIAAASVLGIFVASGCQSAVAAPSPSGKIGNRPGGVGSGKPLKAAPGHALASFSGGCFWGVEEYFRQQPGVVATAVGYTGGITKNPTYEEVCTHTTRHAETVLLEYDLKKTSYAKLLDAFWTIHDPTTVDRQGPDVGDSYRSAIWTYGPEQFRDALASIKAEQKREQDKIVTEVHPAPAFYMAEEYHQQYDEKTGRNTCPPPRKRPAKSGS